MRETSWNFVLERQNAGMLGNGGTSFQFYLFPKRGTPIALNCLKHHCFVASVSRYFFFIFWARSKLKKFENHCSKGRRFGIQSLFMFSLPDQIWKSWVALKHLSVHQKMNLKNSLSWVRLHMSWIDLGFYELSVPLLKVFNGGSKASVSKVSVSFRFSFVKLEINPENFKINWISFSSSMTCKTNEINSPWFSGNH